MARNYWKKFYISAIRRLRNISFERRVFMAIAVQILLLVVVAVLAINKI
jgi:hypothetical protein